MDLKRELQTARETLAKVQAEEHRQLVQRVKWQGIVEWIENKVAQEETIAQEAKKKA